jgi:rod shape-determining protein MreD
VTPGSVVRVAVLIGAVVVLQGTLGLELRIAGAHPEVGWVLPICAGLVAGPEAGAVVGFVTGLATDLLVPTPFGLSALVACLLGFAAGRLATTLSDPGPAVVPLAAAAGSAVAAMLYAVLGAVLGQDQMLRVDLGAVVGVVGVTNAVVALPANRALRWALGRAAPRRRRSAAPGGRW